MPRFLDTAMIALLREPARPGLRGAAYVVGLFPLWTALLLFAVAPGMLDPLFVESVWLLGVPVGSAILVVAGLLMVLGLLAVRWARSPAGVVLTIALLTIPSILLILLGPAIVLVAVNVGTS